MASKRKRSSSRPPKAPAKTNGAVNPSTLGTPIHSQPMPEIRGIVQKTQMHAGPLPSPEQLRDYEEVSSGAADRIITMAERQQGSRIDYQNMEQKRRYDERRLGQIFAFIICMSAFFIAYKLAMDGKQIAASIFGVGGLAGIATAFLKSHSDKAESKKK